MTTLDASRPVGPSRPSLVVGGRTPRTTIARSCSSERRRILLIAASEAPLGRRPRLRSSWDWRWTSPTLPGSTH